MLTISQARWLAVGIVLGVAALTSPRATAQQPAVSKEDLRYDGKTFGYWQTYWRTELKAELRVEAIRAMAAFGANGYAEEAAVAVLEVMKAYDVAGAFRNANQGVNPLRPDDRVVVEAQQALRKIGAPVVPRLLVSNLGDPKIGAVAREMLDCNGLNIAISDIPALVVWSQAKDIKVAAAAVRILYCQTEEKSIEDGLRSAFVRDGVARKLGAALVRVWKEGEDNESYYAAKTLLTNLASTNHVGVELMVEFVKDLAPARQQALEDRAESRRKQYGVPVNRGGLVMPDDRARFVVPEEPTFAGSWGEDRYKLSSDPGAARNTTIELLGLLANKGRAARDLLPLLRDPYLAHDPCRTVRQAVADAIAKIDRPRRSP
jgi:hypothetical protein